jgi:type III restriction enzyme
LYDRSLALKTSDLLELPHDRDRLNLGRKEKNACLPPYILFIALFPTLCFKFLYKVCTSNEYFVSAKDWFAFNAIYGTSEEKAFVRMFDRQMEKLQEQYEQIYLLRNEGHFSIYNFANGQAFQPDFVLFLRKKGSMSLIYQLFIEPKGRHLKEHDRWKEIFLEEITSEFGSKPLTFESKKYRLIGVPFYNNEDENQFIARFESVLN